MRKILITGGTGLVGNQLIVHFLSQGDYVVFTSRCVEKINDIYAQYSQFRDRLFGIPVDLTSDQGVSTLVEALVQNNIEITCLINNVRNIQNLKIEPDHKIKRQNFMDELLLGIIVPYELTMQLTLLPRSKLKFVVNIGSQYGQVVPNPNLYENFHSESPVHYGVSKAGLIHLTKELAVRLAEKNIYVNCVCYGGIRGRVNSEFENRYSKMLPIKRMLTENDLSAPVDFMLSDKNTAITGHILNVDGGWTLC